MEGCFIKSSGFNLLLNYGMPRTLKGLREKNHMNMAWGRAFEPKGTECVQRP